MYIHVCHFHTCFDVTQRVKIGVSPVIIEWTPLWSIVSFPHSTFILSTTCRRYWYHVLYDGKGNFSGTKAFNEWNDRVVWLKQKGVADLRYIAAGLSVDFEYNEAGVENRLKAKS